MCREKANKDDGHNKHRNASDRDAKKDSQSRGRSQSRGNKKDIQCHFCDKYGHMKKDCYAWKRDKGKGKDKGQ